MIGRTLPRESMLVAGQHAWCWREKSTVQATAVACRLLCLVASSPTCLAVAAPCLPNTCMIWFQGSVQRLRNGALRAKWTLPDLVQASLGSCSCTEDV